MGKASLQETGSRSRRKMLAVQPADPVAPLPEIRNSFLLQRSVHAETDSSPVFDDKQL